MYDAVIVLSGELTPERLPTEIVLARLDTAVPYIHQCELVIPNSRGTPHKPPPLNEKRFPVDEAVASAQYLMTHHGLGC